MASTFSISPAVAAGKPTVAVLNFSTRGLTFDWWGAFAPGVALSDLLTNELVHTDRFDVVDRTHLGNVLQEHRLSAAGEVSPATAITKGRLIGARYLIAGNIIQLDKTGVSGALAGAFIPGIFGALIGGLKRTRVTLKVQVRVIDSLTGQIVQSFAAEHTQVATSWGSGGFTGSLAGAYENKSFTNSTMGHLINNEAVEIAKQLAPAKFATNSEAAPSALTAEIIAVDGPNVVLDAGSNKGMSVGMFFDVIRIMHVKDPRSGRILTANEPVGKIQIVSVSAQTAIGRRISGVVAKFDSVQAEQ